MEHSEGAVVKTFEDLLYRYLAHPESKSLAPDGSPSGPHTKGLLGRIHVIAEEHRRIGKESDRKWEEGDDLESLLFKPIEYQRSSEKSGADRTAIAREFAGIGPVWMRQAHSRENLSKAPCPTVDAARIRTDGPEIPSQTSQIGSVSEDLGATSPHSCAG